MLMRAMSWRDCRRQQEVNSSDDRVMFGYVGCGGATGRQHLTSLPPALLYCPPQSTVIRHPSHSCLHIPICPQPCANTHPPTHPPPFHPTPTCSTAGLISL
jgi:hypothetical protein